MRATLTRHTRFVVGAAVGLLAGIAMAGTIAVTAIPDSDDGEIHACVDSRSGLLRVIDDEAGAQCRANESPISWSAGPSCPSGTMPFTGACIEVAERPAPLTIGGASDDCADEGGRLATSAELRAFRDQPGITLSHFEWSADMGDHEGIFRYHAFSENGDALAEAFDDLHYRCVLSPTS